MHRFKKRWLTLMVIPVAVMTMGASCGSSTPSKPNPQAQGQAQTIQAFQQQSTAVPYPLSALTDSTERRNLRERLLRFNKPNRIGYVYIFNFGKVEGYYTIEGKISSTDSQMTTSQLVTKNCGYNQDYCTQVVNAPGDDGSYGANEAGVFFFTTEGALVETNQDYLYSDQPIPTFASLPKLNGTGKVQDLTQRK
jgi:hypothetical protein